MLPSGTDSALAWFGLATCARSIPGATRPTWATCLLHHHEQPGLASTAVAYEVGVSPSSVAAWRSRFAEEGLAKLGPVRPGRGRKPQIPAEKIDEIVRLTQESKPEGETHWSCRSMAKAAGVSPATVQRVWSARGLKPHLVRTFKLADDRRDE
jgi:transposase-like protein